nr:alpha/beta fold hydrolase [Kofleriaceae bacterium]
MQRRHRAVHLLGRGVVAAVSNALMATGAYPLLVHAARRSLRGALGEWACALAASAARPAGFLPLPGAHVHGERPLVMLHGYAMNRANFTLLASRLARGGVGPIVGFEYWSLGRVSTAARQLAAFVDDVRARTGAAQVDLIGHSMGGVVARYYVSFGGGDGPVAHLVTLGSPHGGTDMSALGVGFPSRELVIGAPLVTRLAATPTPTTTKLLTIWSRSDALVPASRQQPIPGAVTRVYDDLGHLALLASRRVAHEILHFVKYSLKSYPECL